MKLMPRLIQISCILILASSPLAAQTSTNLEAKFGVPMTAYEVRSDFLLLVKYAVDGQPCEMRIQPLKFNSMIPDDAAKEILDEVIPIAERGAKDNRIAVGTVGSTATMSERYENVSITTISIFQESCRNCTVLIEIKWKNKICKQRGMFRRRSI